MGWCAFKAEHRRWWATTWTSQVIWKVSVAQHLTWPASATTHIFGLPLGAEHSHQLAWFGSPVAMDGACLNCFRKQQRTTCLWRRQWHRALRTMAWCPIPMMWCCTGGFQIPLFWGAATGAAGELGLSGLIRSWQDPVNRCESCHFVMGSDGIWWDLMLAFGSFDMFWYVLMFCIWSCAKTIQADTHEDHVPWNQFSDMTSVTLLQTSNKDLKELKPWEDSGMLWHDVASCDIMWHL